MKKNSLIELLRFFFATVILLFHAGADAVLINNTYYWGGWKISFFRYGYLGVEFFFVVSGFLMAKEVYKKISFTDDAANMQKTRLGLETIQFLLKKTKSVLPTYFIACAFVAVYFLVVGKELIFVLVLCNS